MSIVVAGSLAVCLAALIWSLILLARSKEWRFTALCTLLAFLVVGQAITAGSAGAFWPLTWQASGQDWCGLGISLLALAVVYFLRQITAEQRRTRTAIQHSQHSQQRLEDLLEASVDHYWEMDKDLRFTWVPRASDPSSRPCAPVILGLNRWELAGGDPERDQLWRGHKADMEAHRPFRDFRFSLADETGRLRYWRVSGKPFVDAGGRFLGYRGTSVDETEEVERRRAAEQALRASENKYLDLYDNAPAMFASIDATTRRVVECNRTFLAATGYRKEEVIGKDLLKVYHPACRAKARTAFRSFVETGSVKDVELQLLAKNGEAIDVVLDVSAVRDAEGAVLYSRSVWRNITDQKRAEAALRESEKRFSDFAEVASDWYWETGPDQRFTYISRRIVRATGLDPDSYFGLRRADLPNLVVDPVAWRQHLEDLEARRPFREFCYGQRLSDGRVLRFRVSGKPLFGDKGQFLGYRGVGSDITAEAEAKKLRREADVRLARAIEAVPAAVALFDPSDRLVICNRECRRIYETPAEPIVPGMPFERLVRNFAASGGIAGTDEDVEAWIAARLDRRTQPARAYEYRCELDRWVEVSDYLLADGSVISVGVNITERKEAEDARRRHDSELAQVLRRSTLDEMAATLAHELNQPLAAIVNFAKGTERRLVDGRLGDRDLREVVGRIATESQRASEIVKRIGRFVGNAQCEREQVDVKEAILTAAALLDAELRTGRIALRLELDEPLAPVLGTSVEFQQVLINLIKNSIDSLRGAATAESEVVIQAAVTEEGAVEIQVRDTGPGFTGIAARRSFEPFFTTKSSGMGMGLSITRSIVRAHGGEITLGNGPGGGAMVKFTFPACREAQACVA